LCYATGLRNAGVEFEMRRDADLALKQSMRGLLAPAQVALPSFAIATSPRGIRPAIAWVSKKIGSRRLGYQRRCAAISEVRF